MAKEYMVIKDLWIEKLIPEMNQLSKQGWSVCYMLQEHANTKVIMEREASNILEREIN